MVNLSPNLKRIFTAFVVLSFGYLGYVVFFSDTTDFMDYRVHMKDVASYVVLATQLGGKVVVDLYNEKTALMNIKSKGKLDVGIQELFTDADVNSNAIMMKVLNRLPNLRVISEEKESSTKNFDIDKYEEYRRPLWEEMKSILNQLPEDSFEVSKLNIWIDPLDATQEYTEGLTEYVTTMGCITYKGEPIFGAVYRPFYNETIIGYGFGNKRWAATKVYKGIATKKNWAEAPKKVVVSRSHAGDVKEVVSKALGNDYEVEGAGGAGYKVLRLLNGTAMYYIHSTTIKKWDTCAGHALLKSVGGDMVKFDGQTIDYTVEKDEDIYSRNGLVAAITNPYTTVKSVRNMF
uniref:inositol-phosphate phosphatase n=1 Tax=Parastrongyloides trichosuri TaxID=131310 RepID=A0A0N5A509_PARTI